jgi:hypothetical protein
VQELRLTRGSKDIDLFQFYHRFAKGQHYRVVILQQPPGQFCSVDGISGSGKGDAKPDFQEMKKSIDSVNIVCVGLSAEDKAQQKADMEAADMQAAAGDASSDAEVFLGAIMGGLGSVLGLGGAKAGPSTAAKSTTGALEAGGSDLAPTEAAVAIEAVSDPTKVSDAFATKASDVQFPADPDCKATDPDCNKKAYMKTNGLTASGRPVLATAPAVKEGTVQDLSDSAYVSVAPDPSSMAIDKLLSGGGGGAADLDAGGASWLGLFIHWGFIGAICLGVYVCCLSERDPLGIMSSISEITSGGGYNAVGSGRGGAKGGGFKSGGGGLAGKGSGFGSYGGYNGGGEDGQIGTVVWPLAS